MALFDTPRMGAAGASGDYFDYEIDQSVRLDNGPYLSSSYSGNENKFTVSLWIKRWKLSSHSMIMSAAGGNHPGGADIHQFGLDSSDRLFAYAYESSCCQRYNIKTNKRLRDVNNWYHLVYIYDSGNSTSSNRIKLYINGELQTDLAESSYPSQNQDNYINDGQPWIIGHESRRFRYPLAAYMAELNFIDGQAYDASYFGESHTVSNQWVPKEYAGSYSGTSFYLKFANGSNFGTDSSGEGNNWSTSSLNSGDKLLDSPTNNWCTFNSLLSSSYTNLTNGNLKSYGNTSSDNGNDRSSFALKSGKWYAELKITGMSGIYPQIGVVHVEDADRPNNGAPQAGYSSSMILGTLSGIYMGNGNKQINNSSSSFGNSFTTNDIIGVAVDADNGAVYFSKNGTFQNSGNPASGNSKTGALLTWTPSDANSNHYISVANYNGSGTEANFGQDSSFAGTETAQGNQDANGYGDFYYSVPSGYKALCSANLPNPSIKLPDKHFDTLLYTGTGTTAQSITGLEFQPDWVWIKSRSFSNNHHLFDSVRGVNKILRASTTDDEDTLSGVMSAFNSDGFTVQEVSGNNATNDNSATFAAWNWKASGSTVTNNDGSVASQVRVNTTAGFSIVTFSGSGNRTIGHGLGVTPQVIIMKGINVTDQWTVGHHKLDESNPWHKGIPLNTTASVQDNAGFWNDTAPTSTVFHKGTWDDGYNMVAYCFSEVAGYSKFGVYRGNSNNNGPFVYLGFTPAWLVVKRRDGSNTNWTILDNKRDAYNLRKTRLFTNSPEADSVSSGDVGAVDFLSNGFKVKDSHQDGNSSSGEYIYMAFAESPFKYSNAN
tara:strand:+ start:477 stop:2957 length:2481 start_codon:yes stop_codon:yes gene_type:complete